MSKLGETHQPSQLPEDVSYERSQSENFRNAGNHNPVLSFDPASDLWSQSDIMDPDAFFFSDLSCERVSIAAVPSKTSHFVTSRDSLGRSEEMPSSDTLIHDNSKDYLYCVGSQLERDLGLNPRIGGIGMELLTNGGPESTARGPLAESLWRSQAKWNSGSGSSLPPVNYLSSTHIPSSLPSLYRSIPIHQTSGERWRRSRKGAIHTDKARLIWRFCI